MLSILARAKCTVIVCISGSSWKHLLCVSWNKNATSWSCSVSAQTLTLCRAKRLDAGRMIDTKKKITCALSFELTDFLSMNSHLMDLELLLE